jgi:hypothetical protein
MTALTRYGTPPIDRRDVPMSSISLADLAFRFANVCFVPVSIASRLDMRIATLLLETHGSESNAARRHRSDRYEYRRRLFSIRPAPVGWCFSARTGLVRVLLGKGPWRRGEVSSNCDQLQ